MEGGRGKVSQKQVLWTSQRSPGPCQEGWLLEGPSGTVAGAMDSWVQGGPLPARDLSPWGRPASCSPSSTSDRLLRPEKGPALLKWLGQVGQVALPCRT